MAEKYLLTTLGCKVNQYESQQIRELLEEAGLRPATRGEAPDLAVINTCAVTGRALAKSRQAIRRATRAGARSVVVVGCGVSAQGRPLLSIPGVIAALGHEDDMLMRLRNLLSHRMESKPVFQSESANHTFVTPTKSPQANGYEERMIPVSTPLQSAAGVSEPTDSRRRIIPAAEASVKESPTLDGTIHRFDDHQRAFLKVQDGCDAFCTYCIIPRLRPRLAWKPVDVAVGEAADLVRSGHKEIVLTGIFLGAYGRDTARERRFDAGGSPLADLVRALADLDGLERLRLSSLEPGDVDDALLGVLARKPNCVPHLHLPLQSGCDEILRRMHRQYDADAYYRMIERVTARLDRPAITTDVIVGFPGEKDSDFEDTLRVAREAGFAKIHAFPYSPRPGTAAALWTDGRIPADEVRDRMRRLHEVELHTSFAFRRSFIGEIQRVIVEDRLVPAESDGVPFLTGRADRYFDVRFPQVDGVDVGDTVLVRIDRLTPTRTHGTCTSAKS